MWPLCLFSKRNFYWFLNAIFIPLYQIKPLKHDSTSLAENVGVFGCGYEQALKMMLKSTQKCKQKQKPNHLKSIQEKYSWFEKFWMCHHLTSSCKLCGVIFSIRREMWHNNKLNVIISDVLEHPITAFTGFFRFSEILWSKIHYTYWSFSIFRKNSPIRT